MTCRFLKNEPLKHYTSFRVGGPADLMALPGTLQELREALVYADAQGLPVTLLGGGTNVLISDNGIRGMVIVTTSMASGIKIVPDKTGLLEASAGERLSSICRFAASKALSGLEFAAGIPGTLGGAIAMNAGIPERNMSEVVSQITVVDPSTGSVKHIPREAMTFSYRRLEPLGIIVAATMILTPGDRDAIESAIQRQIRRKNETQPVSSASAGCFFKNPTHGMPAGALIEQSGLKGKRINDAMVSEIHANYIVNIGRATCADILALKEQIQKTVFEKFGVQLESEVRVEGE